MHLAEITIKNFRSCVNCRVELSPHVTVLVGENGSGKSNIIDALRLTIDPVTGRRYSYLDPERDLANGFDKGTTISVEQVYQELTLFENSMYTDKLVDGNGSLINTIEFDTRVGITYRSRFSRYYGSSRIPDQDTVIGERVGCVYLPPLRDAARDFDSSEGNRLHQILSAFGDEAKEQQMLDIGNSTMKDLSEADLVKDALEIIQSHLSRLTHPTRSQSVGVAYKNQNLEKLARLLRLEMAETGFHAGDLTRAGLGYTNLLYIASVIIELEKATGKDLTLVLVEEPEAHLHPQLQMVLLQYLYSRAKQSHIDAPANGAAGRIQVIVTSHSPNLASAVSTSDVVVVKGGGYESGDDELTNRTTIAIPLKKRDLSESQRRKVDRYLTVTRASLLFSQRILLVEGLSEAILLQQLAESCVFVDHTGDAEETKKARTRREAMSAVSIISIDGVDFEPYLKLLFGASTPLTERVVVLTDKDTGQGTDRKERYHQMFPAECAAGSFGVFVGHATLEANLLAIQENEPLIQKCYLESHSKSEAKWLRIVGKATGDEEGRAAYFYDRMKDEVAADHLDFEKGEFSQLLAEQLVKEGDNLVFRVPAYIHDALIQVIQ